jgi:hypothetical protein
MNHTCREIVAASIIGVCSVVLACTLGIIAGREHYVPEQTRPTPVTNTAPTMDFQEWYRQITSHPDQCTAKKLEDLFVPCDQGGSR